MTICIRCRTKKCPSFNKLYDLLLRHRASTRDTNTAIQFARNFHQRYISMNILFTRSLTSPSSLQFVPKAVGIPTANPTQTNPNRHKRGVSFPHICPTLDRKKGKIHQNRFCGLCIKTPFCAGLGPKQRLPKASRLHVAVGALVPTATNRCLQ